MGVVTGGGSDGSQPFVGVGVYVASNPDIASGIVPFNAVDFGSPAFLDSGTGIVIPAGLGGVYNVQFVGTGTYTEGETFIDVNIGTPNGGLLVPCVLTPDLEWRAAGSYPNVLPDGTVISVSMTFEANPTIHITGGFTELFVSRISDAP